MKRVIRWAIQNSPAMNTVLIASLLVGAISLVLMRREIFPEFQLEIILVTMVYPGATTADVEEGVCEKIEAAVKDVDGVKKITSVARENAGFIILELNNNVSDVQRVLNDVRSQIDQITSFPPLAEDPNVQQIVFKAPAINVGILAPENSNLDPLTQQRHLRDLAEEIRDDLLQLPPTPPKTGVRSLFGAVIAPPGRPAISTADIIAARDYEVSVEISEDTLRQYGLSLQTVAQILRTQNLDLPGGKLETASQEVLLRSKNKSVEGAEIAKIPIITHENGDTVTVGDLGDVIDGFAQDTSEHLVDGRPALVISVARTSDEDLLTVVDTVKEYVANKKMPAGYELKLWQDLSIDVRDRIEMLTRNGVQGLILVFIVLAIFLDLRLAFWVALGIPVSILGSGFILLMMGQTLNMLSMFAFLMALGIVVDDAIVIGENIYSKRQEGMNSVRAAIEGTYEVLPSVCASVTTTIIAFMPLMFVSGVMGKFIAVMPAAVIAMLVISLFESMLILPCHLSHENNLFLRMTGGALYVFKFLLVPFAWVNRKATGMMEWCVNRMYVPMLGWSLQNKPIVLSAATGLMILAGGFVYAGIVPFEAFPKIDSRSISSTIVFPDGTNAASAREATIRLEQALREVDEEVQDEYGHTILSNVYRRIGEVGDDMRGPTGVTNGSHVGTVEAELVAAADRDLTSDEINQRWRKKMPKFPGVEALKFGSRNMGPGGAKIEFKLLAQKGSEKYLELAAEECKEYLDKIKGVYDIEDDMRDGKWEMRFKPNKEGTSLGLTQRSLGDTVRSTYFGEEVMRLQRGEHEVKLMVRYPKSERESIEGLEEIRIRDEEGIQRPFLDLADIEYDRAESEINRLNLKRSITVVADINKAEGANQHLIVETMKTEFMPNLISRYQQQFGARLYVNWEGQAQQTAESFSSMGAGFSIAMICMFLLLTLEFRSYLQPLIIMAIIPFGMVGAVAGHAVMGLELTLFSMFGLIALTGVVVNDSIVLVDFINHRVCAGIPLDQALIDAGRRRFRPIMLTSITTMAGLFPMMLERSFQAQVLIPMATTLVFGLMTGTMLILILVPVFYQIYGKFTGIEYKLAMEKKGDPTPELYGPEEKTTGFELDPT